MGKTAVFVLSTLQSLEEVKKEEKKEGEEEKKEEKKDEEKKGSVQVVVLCHARELAFQIKREYDRFAKYFPWVRRKR